MIDVREHEAFIHDISDEIWALEDILRKEELSGPDARNVVADIAALKRQRDKAEARLQHRLVA